MSTMHDLTAVFNREAEILEATASGIVYALDQKSDSGNRCVIGYYDFEQGSDQAILSLDGTRIYESFRSYGAMKDYFYAAVVLSDYKLCLQEIDKQSWKVRQSFCLVPEGEILNFYPVNQDYLIVIDEVAATDELLMRFDDEDFGGKYYTLTYLYHLKTGEKWYMQAALDGQTVADVQAIPLTGGGNQLVFHLQAGGSNQDKLWNVTDGALIDAMKAGTEVPFTEQEGHPGSTIARTNSEDGSYCYRIHEVETGVDSICCLRETGGQIVREVTARLQLPDDGEIIYGAEDAHIYHVTGEADNRICVEDLQDGERQFTYDAEYGDFTGIWLDDTAVTIFYRTEMMREDVVFRECVALHHTNDDSVTVFEGICERKGRHLLLMRSYMCL